jgi:hypothetical protein
MLGSHEEDWDRRRHLRLSEVAAGQTVTAAVVQGNDMRRSDARVGRDLRTLQQLTDAIRAMTRRIAGREDITMALALPRLVQRTRVQPVDSHTEHGDPQRQNGGQEAPKAAVTPPSHLSVHLFNGRVLPMRTQLYQPISYCLPPSRAPPKKSFAASARQPDPRLKLKCVMAMLAPAVFLFLDLLTRAAPSGM